MVSLRSSIVYPQLYCYRAVCLNMVYPCKCNEMNQDLPTSLVKLESTVSGIVAC